MNIIQEFFREWRALACCSMMQCVAVRYILYELWISCTNSSVSAGHSLAVCCSVLQCVAVCCSVLQCIWMMNLILCKKALWYVSLSAYHGQRSSWINNYDCRSVLGLVTDLPSSDLFSDAKTKSNICVAVCCSMLQYVAACCSKVHYFVVCCSMLQYVAVCCSMLQYVAVCYSMLQSVAVYCSMLQYVAVCCSMLQHVTVCCSMLQYVTVCCSMLQYVTICYSMLQYVAVCRSMLQYVAVCCRAYGTV